MKKVKKWVGGEDVFVALRRWGRRRSEAWVGGEDILILRAAFFKKNACMHALAKILKHSLILLGELMHWKV